MIPAFEQVKAAAATQPAAVAGLIDWPVSGAGRLVRAAVEVDPTDHLEIVGRGVAELLGAAASDPVQLLGPDVAYLNEHPELSATTPAEDEQIRFALQVGPLPDDIAEGDRIVLERLAAHTVSITHTAVLRFAGDRRWGLAVGDFERVALVRRLTQPRSAA